MFLHFSLHYAFSEVYRIAYNMEKSIFLVMDAFNYITLLDQLMSIPYLYGRNISSNPCEFGHSSWILRQLSLTFLVEFHRLAANPISVSCGEVLQDYRSILMVYFIK